MAKIPGGRAPRDPRDYAEWLKQRADQSKNIQIRRVYKNFDRPNEIIEARANSFYLFSKDMTVQMPSAAANLGQTIIIKADNPTERRVAINVVPRDGEQFDFGNTTCRIGNMGNVTFTSLGDRWTLSGDQGIRFSVARSASIDAQNLGSDYMYINHIQNDTAKLWLPDEPVSTTQGLFTIPEHGYYYFSGRLAANADANIYAALAFTRNGTVSWRGARTTSYATNHRIGVTGQIGPMHFTKSWTIGILGESNGTIPYVNGAAESYFFGYKLPN